MALTSGKYDAAHVEQYGDTNPSFEDIYNTSSWWQRTGRLRDQGLLDQGYTHWEGSADATAEELSALGYYSQASLGGTSADGYNTYYKAAAPTPTAAPAPSSGGGGGISLPTAPASAPAPAPIVAPEPEPIFRAGSQTGAEVGGDFKTFQGGGLKLKNAEGAAGLRIGAPTAPSQTRDVKKKKQLNTLGLNINQGGVGIQI